MTASSSNLYCRSSFLHALRDTGIDGDYLRRYPALGGHIFVKTRLKSFCLISIKTMPSFLWYLELMSSAPQYPIFLSECSQRDTCKCSLVTLADLPGDSATVGIDSTTVLGLNGSPTQQQITTRYRKLSREWHPDKHKYLEQKQLAQEKFIEIQQAYEILSKIKSDRVAQNVRDPSSEEDIVYQPAYQHDL
ncbi:dnaJ subfamily C member 22 [Trichonephila clavipes]|nr:dnaJ subfamily C member 22 [Trichonephila clavipes]